MDIIWLQHNEHLAEHNETDDWRCRTTSVDIVIC